jgi:hypothetical protein
MAVLVSSLCLTWTARGSNRRPHYSVDRRKINPTLLPGLISFDYLKFIIIVILFFAMVRFLDEKFYGRFTSGDDLRMLNVYTVP